MKISVDRVISRLEEIYECGRQADGTHARVAYSPEGEERFLQIILAVLGYRSDRMRQAI